MCPFLLMKGDGYEALGDSGAHSDHVHERSSLITLVILPHKNLAKRFLNVVVYEQYRFHLFVSIEYEGTTEILNTSLKQLLLKKEADKKNITSPFYKHA